MPTQILSDRERRTLATVCDTFHPSLAAEPGDDAVLFSMAASDLGVPAAAELAIARLGPAERGDLRQLLRLLDNPVFGLIVSGVPHGISKMSPDQAAEFLLALSSSLVPQLRSGFQALKRLSGFLYYSVTNANGESRVWSRIRYEPSNLPPPRAERLVVTTVSAETKLDADVCVIGSGAGGGVAAAVLASRGLKVVVLEAGPADQAGDFTQRELEGTQRLYLDSGLAATKDLSLSILAGSCLGGGTTVNWQSALRTPDNIRDEWTTSSGCDVFTSDRFSRALDAVTARTGSSTNESAVNANNATIQRGCESLGYSCSLLARNSVGCSTDQCGYCTFGCRVGGKQSTTVTYLRDAQRNGDTTIIAECRAEQVTISGGRVIGVIASAEQQDGSRVRVTVRAPRVVVAAGGIQSPALLLRSAISSPQLGRNLYLHPTTATVGFYADLIQTWCGPPQTIISDQFASLDGAFGFRLEVAPAHPGLLGVALPWTSAVDHRRVAQRFAHGSVIIVLSRDADGGRVRVRRDGSPVIEYVPTRRQQAIIARGFAEAARVHLAAGAEEVFTLHTRPQVLSRTPSTTRGDIDAFCERVLGQRVDRNHAGLFSAHQMGTCRMGRDARSGVCDERGQVFGARGLYVADASAFPRSSGVNPMITVMALAKTIAEGIE